MLRGARSTLGVVLPFLAHALAREVDRALGLVLRAEAQPGGLVSEVSRAMAADASGAVIRVALWLAAGIAVVAGRAWWQRRSAPPASEPPPESATFAAWPLLLRPSLSLLALLSVALQPSYPYAFTLPVALTQDWGIAQDALALAALLALHLRVPRIPAPRAAEVFVLSFLAYGALVPESAWHWDSHPGNEPKTLRQAVALGHWLTFDSEAVTGPMESLETRPLAAAVSRAASAFASESSRMLGAVFRGEAGRDAIRATRISRQVVRGKEGGVFSVLSPGPAMLLAPALRVDRAINRARGTPGRVAVGVLLFCAFAALLVSAVFQLVRDATSSASLASALALGFALVPPFLFYFHQFYPEMLGALLLAAAFRTVAFSPERIRLHAWRFGSLVALLPWLHQKFFPVWGVLVVTALLVGWRSPVAKGEAGGGWRWAARVALPNLASLYLFALYNFAVTASVRPDALFLAWGPGGVSGARLGQGLLGLLLDSRFGILPYVPLLALAVAGLVLGGARRFAPVLPAALVYYLTVASADNWSGAVCNLGRYFMPLAPLAVALVGVAVARVTERRGAATLLLTLGFWTALLALALRQDPQAANDSWLLLAKSTYADGRLYIPGLFIRTWADAAPGLTLRLLAWLLLVGAATLWLRRVAASSGQAGASPLRALAGTAATLLVVALALEGSGPPTRTRPAWRGALALDPAATLFLEGQALVREDEAVIGPGAVAVLLRAPEARSSLALTVGGGGGFLHAAGRQPLPLRATGTILELPLSAYHEVRGRDRSVFFSRGYLWLDQEAVIRPRPMELAGDQVR